MNRIIFALTLALAMIVGVMGGSPARSLALQASPTPEPTPPAEVCAETESDNWEDEIDVRPWDAGQALVTPLDSPDHDLYLAVWTIEPGTCVPYAAAGNQKDGAVVLIVQQGVVEFTWQPYSDESPATVTWGHGASDTAGLVPGETQTLNRDDWIAQNDQVWFTLRSVGSEPAVILKAVWTTAPPEGEVRCGGGCK
jgi:hypothetical protein